MAETGTADPRAGAGRNDPRNPLGAGSGTQPRFYLPLRGSKSLRAPEALGAALFVACGFAAFAHGAIRAPAQPRLEVGVAAVAGVAATVGALRRAEPTGRGARASLPRAALAGLVLLGLFTLWSALSLAWSAAPDGTWTSLNRLITYGLVLAMGLAVGARARRPLALARTGLLALSTLVLLDALGQKVVPGLHVAGLINLNGTAQLGRLQAPVGYWNALALLLVLGGPAALSLALGQGAGRAVRSGAFIVVELTVVGVGFTESRGGLLALAVALTTMVLLSPDRLLSAIIAAAAVLGGGTDLAVSLASGPLTGNGVPLPGRESAGALLGVVLIATATLSVLALPRLERLGALTSPQRRRVGRAVAITAAGAVLAALLAAALGRRGLPGEIAHLWTGFNHADSIATSGASRLLSDSSANRVAWWGQALAAFTQRPLGGWGAGSFPVINLLFRHDGVTALDAHSVPLQWLAQTGLVGALLALGAWLALLRAGIMAARRAGAERVDPTRLDTPAAADRLAAAAVLGAAAAFGLHALIDWDWEIPAVTLPVLVALGMLAGSLGRPGPRLTQTVVPEPVRVQHRLGSTARVLAVAASIGVLTLVAISAVLPALAASRAGQALAEAAGPGPGALARASRAAAQASALDPLSPAGPLAQADIAQAEGGPNLARELTIVAVRRQPTDVGAWQSLVGIDVGLGRGAEALDAARRVLALDPRIGVVGLLTLAAATVTAEREIAPPQGSASATPAQPAAGS